MSLTARLSTDCLISLARSIEGKHCPSSFNPYTIIYMHAMRNIVLIGKPCTTFLTPHPIASSSFRPLSVLTKGYCRLRPIPPNSISPRRTFQYPRSKLDASIRNMSQKPFSNTEVPGDKPADPYKATNLTDPDLKEKVRDLVKFMEYCKFGMMTTRIESSGLLTSRCMALAATVRPHHIPSLFTIGSPSTDSVSFHRKAAASISSSTPTPNPARPTT